jgi:Skp family chaperone for outer membrane proteins
MRTKVAILVVLLAVVMSLGIGFGSAIAQSKAQIEPPRVGIVSLRTVLEQCDKNAAANKKFEADGQSITRELKALQEEATSLEAVLKTRKPGSEDYMEKMQQFMQKKAVLDSKDKFHQQRFAIQQQRFAEELLQEVIVATGEVAKSYGLDIVLAKEEFEFPVESSNELMLMIKTSKVLYYADKLEITADILAAMNAKK